MRLRSSFLHSQQFLVINLQVRNVSQYQSISLGSFSAQHSSYYAICASCEAKGVLIKAVPTTGARGATAPLSELSELGYPSWLMPTFLCSVNFFVSLPDSTTVITQNMKKL